MNVTRRIFTWFSAHPNWAAGVIVAGAFAAVLATLQAHSLSPDECLHLEIASAPSLQDVYQISWYSAHPPLVFFLLRFWTKLGRSDFWLRLFPALCGAGFLWFAWRWAGRLMGKGAGFLTLLVLAFAPVFRPLSGELRGYSLFLLLTAVALAELERALAERRSVRLLISSVLLVLAALTHYSAFFVVVILFIYAGVRLWKDRPAPRFAAVWVGCQIALAALCVLLYVTKVRQLRGFEQRAMAGWLETSYFHRGQENLLWFAARQTTAFFIYLFGSPFGAASAFVLATVGVACLAWRRNPAAVLLGLPVVLAAALAVLRLYPLGATRHSAYLFPFAAAAIGASIAPPLRGRLWSAVVPCLALAPLFWGEAAYSVPSQRHAETLAALDRLRELAPAHSLLLVDSQTCVVLWNYLGRDDWKLPVEGVERFLESGAGGYCIVSSPLWSPLPKDYGDEVERLIRAYRLPPEAHFWVVRVGVGFDPGEVLRRRFPNAIFPQEFKFDKLDLVEMWLTSEQSPGAGQVQEGGGADTRGGS